MAPTTRHLQDRRPLRPPNPENIRKRAAAKAKTKNCHNPPQVRPPSPTRCQPESESEEAYVEPAPANQIVQPPANQVTHAAQRVQAPVVICINDSDGETKKKKHNAMFYQIKGKIQKKLWRVCKFVTCADDRMKVAQKCTTLKTRGFRVFKYIL